MAYLVHHLLTSIDSSFDWESKEAIVQGEKRISYKEVEDYTNRLANGLLEAGLKRGDRVGVYLEKSVEEVLSIFSISKAGGIFVPINILLLPGQIEHILNDCGVSVLITAKTKLSLIQKIIPNITSLKFIVLIDADSDMQPIDQVLVLDSLFKGASEISPEDICLGQDLAAIIYTSGSTGRPKGVMLSHQNLLAGSRIVSKYLELTQSDRILSLLPFSFDYGLNQLITAFQQKATIILLNFRFPKEIIDALLEERITGLAGVPSLWVLLVQSRSPFRRHSFPDLRYITNSGGAMPRSILDGLRQTLPATRVFLMYGLTEAFRSTYLPPEELDGRPNSMGKAIPETEIFVVNDHGRLCSPGEVGELVHRGPTVFLGYWGHPEASSKVLQPNAFLPSELNNTERVCYSGDLVYTDEEGFLYFVGRRDTTIKSSGYRISPTEVEEVLYSSGFLQEVAVIGVADDVLGHYIKGFVVPQGLQDVDVDKLLLHCVQRMPRYMIPRRIEILKELPKTANGKIDYQSLARRKNQEKPLKVDNSG